MMRISAVLVAAAACIGVSACGSSVSDTAIEGSAPSDNSASMTRTVNYDSPEQVAAMLAEQSNCINLPSSEQSNACVREIVDGTTITMHGTVREMYSSELRVVNDNPKLYTDIDYVPFTCPQGVAGCGAVDVGDPIYIVAKIKMVDGIPTNVIESITAN